MFREIFERICKEHEWDSIEQLLSEGQYQTKISLIELATKEFTRKMCDKQKEICFSHALPYKEGAFGNYYYQADIKVEKETILNAPYPDELQGNN